MNAEYILKCVEDTKNMAKKIAPFLKNNIIFLNGEIGAGKTTFTKYLVEAYGLADE
ncbi:MAG: tRNA (adenosine(37)-N6)-threonylcarbamoyltransferase complex ATPase subunit type 1 TsaE, partial [Mucispirillum sp.]|nr:tRNA (adenosine(37)-N6)-threonylcarbamoyltransferase complex ATPase subunit type 1 TsaE [Mucispirillum sp.]